MNGHPRGSLITALEQARGLGTFSRLEQLYQQIPETTCQRSNRCCILLPPLYPIETAACFDRMRGLTSKERSAQAQALMTYFLGNASAHLACPWSADNACTCYEGRFFSCRAYGLWSAEVYGQRRQVALKGQDLIRKAWQGLGVDLPAEVTSLEHDYCGQVQVVDGRRPTDQELNDLEECIAALGEDSEAFKMLAPYAGDPSFAVAAMCLGQPQSLAAKLSYTKHVLAGELDEAGEMLAKAKIQAKRWAMGW